MHIIAIAEMRDAYCYKLVGPRIESTRIVRTHHVHAHVHVHVRTGTRTRILQYMYE